MTQHAASIVDAAVQGRIGDALDMLGDAFDLDAKDAPRPQLLHLLDAVLVPDAGEFVAHRSDFAPVPADVLVVADLGEMLLVERAGMLAWRPGLGPSGEGRIHRYAILPRPCAHLPPRT